MAEPTFRIEGREYPIPTQETLTMDEAVLIHDYSGITLDQIPQQPGNPKVLKALVHIAYQRGHPDADQDVIRDMIGMVTLVDLLGAVEEEDDAVPPAPTTSESSASSSDSPPSSGDDSSEPSTTSQGNGHQSATGTPESDTPRIFVPATSEDSPRSSY